MRCAYENVTKRFRIYLYFFSFRLTLVFTESSSSSVLRAPFCIQPLQRCKKYLKSRYLKVPAGNNHIHTLYPTTSLYISRISHLHLVCIRRAHSFLCTNNRLRCSTFDDSVANKNYAKMAQAAILHHRNWFRKRVSYKLKSNADKHPEMVLISYLKIKFCLIRTYQNNINAINFNSIRFFWQ